MAFTSCRTRVVFQADSLESMGPSCASSFRREFFYFIYSLLKLEVKQTFFKNFILQKYGLRDLPTATYPDNKEGVTRSCTREQAAQSYIYFEDAFDSLDRLKDLCHTIPVHTILGTNQDLVSKKTHDAIIDPKQGRPMASILHVDSGHLESSSHSDGANFTDLLPIDRTGRTGWIGIGDLEHTKCRRDTIQQAVMERAKE